MEQVQEPRSAVNIPEDWQKLEPQKLLNLLDKATLHDVVSFARSSPEANSFIQAHKSNIIQLNPISILIEDIFPAVVDNVYEFSVLVRSGNVHARDEIIRAPKESDLREILELLSPDIVQVRLTYPSGFESDIQKMVGKPLQPFQISQLKRVGILRQIKRQNDKLISFLASNGLTTDSLFSAKEEVLHDGAPQSMSTDVYDTALALEESERQLIFELNMMECTGVLVDDDAQEAEFKCCKGDSENQFC